MSQALPLVTVMLGSETSDQNVTMITLSEDADEPREIHFHLPTDGTLLSPGSPKWANYVKGVIQHYRGTPICQRLSVCLIPLFLAMVSYDLTQRSIGESSLILMAYLYVWTQVIFKKKLKTSLTCISSTCTGI